MSVTLAGTWQPRGELPRFERFHAQLMSLFANIVLIMPPDEAVLAERVNGLPGVRALASGRWPQGRTESLAQALQLDGGHLLYCDFDRVLHWLECYPDELAEAVRRTQSADCLVIGRTARAFQTHPRCMRDSEQIINEVFAHVCGLPFDICVATRGLSRTAAERILAETRVQSPLGVDGEWLYLLQRAGVPIDYMTVEGMEWETADQFLEFAADADTRQRAADAYDADTRSWGQRLYVAQQIISALLAVAKTA